MIILLAILIAVFAYGLHRESLIVALSAYIVMMSLMVLWVLAPHIIAAIAAIEQP